MTSMCFLSVYVMKGFFYDGTMVSNRASFLMLRYIMRRRAEVGPWMGEAELNMKEQAGKLQMRKWYGDRRMASTEPHAASAAKP